MDSESCLPYSLQLVLLGKVSMEVDFENCGKIVSPSDFVIAARTHVRVLYSNPVLMVVHVFHYVCKGEKLTKKSLRS